MYISSLFLPTAVLLVLIFPPAVEYDLLSEKAAKQLKHVVTEIYLQLKQKLNEYHARHQR